MIGLNERIVLLFFAAVLVLVSGCLDSRPAEWNRAVCEKFNSTYGSFSGTVCGQELVEGFGKELAELRQFGRGDIADNVQNTAAQKGFFNFFCNASDLGAGVELTNGGNCETDCVQTGNSASCAPPPGSGSGSAGNGGSESDGIVSLAELLDLWEQGPLVNSLNDVPSGVYRNFCRYSVMNDDAFLYKRLAGALYCDPRPEKENKLVSILCERGEKSDPYTGWIIQIRESDCLNGCETLSSRNAVCQLLDDSGEDGSGPGSGGAEACGNGICAENESCAADCDYRIPTEEPAEACLGDGITGPNALRIRLDWEPEKIDYTTCEKFFCDSVQATWSLLDRLHRIEELYNETGNLEDERIRQLSFFKMALTKSAFSKDFFKEFVDYHEKNVGFLPSWFSDWKNYLTENAADSPALISEEPFYGIASEFVPRIGFFVLTNKTVEEERVDIYGQQTFVFLYKSEDSAKRVGSFGKVGREEIAPGAHDFLVPREQEISSYDEQGNWQVFESGIYSMRLSIRFEDSSNGFFVVRNGVKSPNAIVAVVLEQANPEVNCVVINACPLKTEKPEFSELYDFFSLNGSMGSETGFSAFLAKNGSEEGFRLTPSLSIGSFTTENETKKAISREFIRTVSVNEDTGFSKFTTVQYNLVEPPFDVIGFNVVSLVSGEIFTVYRTRDQTTEFYKNNPFVFFSPGSIQPVLAVTENKGIAFTVPNGTRIIDERLLAVIPLFYNPYPDQPITVYSRELYSHLHPDQQMDYRNNLLSAFPNRFNDGCGPVEKTMNPPDQNAAKEVIARWREDGSGIALGLVLQSPLSSTPALLKPCTAAEEFSGNGQTVTTENQALELGANSNAVSTLEQALKLVQRGKACIVKRHDIYNEDSWEAVSIVWNTDTVFEEETKPLLEKQWPALEAERFRKCDAVGKCV